MSDFMQRKLHFLSTPRYTQNNVSPLNFQHSCTRYPTLCVPQRLIFTNELVHFWSHLRLSVYLVCVKPPLSNMFTLPLCSSFTERSADALGQSPRTPLPGG